MFEEWRSELHTFNFPVPITRDLDPSRSAGDADNNTRKEEEDVVEFHFLKLIVVLKYSIIY